jgi:class 3 adenylate cyclase
MMTPVRRDLPSGTVTFLFTDVEGSTTLLHELGADEYADALAEHRRILRGAFGAHGGVEVDTQGDAFFVAFPTAPGALEVSGCPVKKNGFQSREIAQDQITLLYPAVPQRCFYVCQVAIGAPCSRSR